MQSIQLVAQRRLELRIMPDPPDPGPGEVTVRVRAVGICGSDMHYYLEGSCVSTPAPYPCVLGHEPAGEIVAVGRGVESVAAGARVAIEPAIQCGQCEYCRAGRHNLCDNVIFLGGVQQPGLLREFVTLPARNVVPIPDSLSYPLAATIEPLAVVLHAFELAGIEAGHTVAVLGAGPIGLLSAAVARTKGAGQVIVADRVPHRLELACQMGASAVVDISRQAADEAILDLTGGRGAHLILDAAGQPDSMNAALRAVRHGGRIVLIGIPSDSLVGLDVHAALHKEATLIALKRSNRNDHEALELIESGRVPVARLVTHRFPLARAEQAFQTLAAYADGVAKAVVEL